MLPPNNDSTEESGDVQQFSIRLPGPLWERLGHLCVNLRASKAKLIAEALERFLTSEETRIASDQKS